MFENVFVETKTDRRVWSLLSFAGGGSLALTFLLLLPLLLFMIMDELSYSGGELPPPVPPRLPYVSPFTTSCKRLLVRAVKATKVASDVAVCRVNLGGMPKIDTLPGQFSGIMDLPPIPPPPPSPAPSPLE
jgi:hypothetical protein